MKWNCPISTLPFYTPTDFDDATLWLDATVEDSIEVDEFGFVDSWENLLDGSVKLYSENNKPINGASLNGRNAIDFNFGEDEAGNAYYDSMSAKTTGGQDWSALSSDGSIGGSYSDVTIFIVFQVDTNRRTAWPFGTGWGGHFPWSDGRLYHDTPRRVVFTLSTGEEEQPMLFQVKYSNTEKVREFYKNGFTQLTDYRISQTDAWKFTFPKSHWERQTTQLGRSL